MTRPRVVVIGAGMGGLAAAIDLSARGADVIVVERGSQPGGKMRQIDVGTGGIDAGPTVFTMRWIFDRLFAAANTKIEDHLTLYPADILARHAWTDGSTLDLFADIERSAAAIEAFSDRRNAQGYRDFCARSAEIFGALKHTFIAGQRPSPLSLVGRMGLRKLPVMLRTTPMQTLWSALGKHFPDPRLRQLFGRYSTYCGSSPMLTPATLMLVAHVEQDGVWQVKGGMIEVARAMQRIAIGLNAQFEFDTLVRDIQVRNGRVQSVHLNDGRVLDADAIVFNGDTNALASGKLGGDVASAVDATPVEHRSLSAITWCTSAQPHGFDLTHHNVFFGDDYHDEFDAVFKRRDITSTPTVYLCAQDRTLGRTPTGHERMLLLVNAPPDGDRNDFDDDYVADIDERARVVMQRCGLTLAHEQRTATTPRLFDGLFPATGGALYGRATHGAFSTFARHGAETRIGGLFVAGGSAHPGPGIPMATMSGRLAAEKVAARLGLKESG